MKRFQFRAGQMIQGKGESGILLDLLAADDEALARTTSKQRYAGVDANDLKYLFRIGKITR